MTVKVLALLTKLPQMTDEAFHAHWRHPHGTLTQRMRQITRYVQNHGIGSVAALPGLPQPEFQGVPAIWIPSLATLSEMFVDPSYEALAADALLLYDQASLSWLITNEHVTHGAHDENAARTPIKAMVFFNRRSAAPAAAFEAALMSVASQLPKDSAAVQTCSVSVPIVDAYPPPQRPAFAAILEVSFPDRASLAAAWPSLLQRLTSAPLGPLVDLDATRGFLAAEERVI